MTFPRYPDYKDSGIDWLGEVPAHWNAVPLWTMFRRTKRTGFPEAELLSVYRDYGVVPKASRDDNFNNASEDLTAYQLVEPGCLAINKMKAWQGSVGISRYRGIVSPAYFIYEPLHDNSSEYLHYLLRSSEYAAAYMMVSKGIRVNQWDLDPQYHSRLPVLLPPPSEQSAIAAFLDRETGKIDALVAEQEKLIALLKEKRQAVISHAVTKGLDPSAPMKDSGIEWLGEVPAHWDAVRIKYHTLSIEQGWSPQCEGFPVETAEEWGVLKVGCVNGGVFKPSENKRLPEELEPIPSLGIAAGDLLISRANTKELVGGAAVAHADYPRLMLSDKLYRLRLDETASLPDFVAFFLGTGLARGQIELAATGASSSMQNIGQGTILGMAAPLPPVPEQSVIVAFLNDQTAKFDALTAEAQRAIELLKEHRSALISAAITGKIDVRGLVSSQEAA